MWRGLGRVRCKKKFPETISHKSFETNSISREIAHYISVFQSFFATTDENCISGRGLSTSQ